MSSIHQKTDVINPIKLIIFALVLPTLILISLVMIVSFPSVFNRIRHAREGLAKQDLKEISRTQQAKYKERGFWSHSIQELGQNIKSETDYYKYSIQSTKNASFLYAIPKSKNFRGYILGLFVVPSKPSKLAENKMTITSTLCIETEREEHPLETILIRPYLVQGVPMCPLGTQEVTK